MIKIQTVYASDNNKPVYEQLIYKCNLILIKNPLTYTFRYRYIEYCNLKKNNLYLLLITLYSAEQHKQFFF